MKIKYLFVVVCFALAGCATLFEDQKQAEIDQARGALRNLSKAMESCYRFDKPSPGLSDEQLMTFCTQHNPRIREFYENFQVKFKEDHGYAVVLVCTKDGKWLMEDCSCTGTLDEQPAQGTDKPCVFTIKALEVCPQLAK